MARSNVKTRRSKPQHHGESYKWRLREAFKLMEKMETSTNPALDPELSSHLNNIFPPFTLLKSKTNQKTSKERN